MKNNGTHRFVNGLTRKNFLVSLVTLAVSSCLYGYAILAAPKVFHNFITISFLAVLFCVFVSNLLEILRAAEEDSDSRITALLLYAAAIHLCLILGFYLSGIPETALWVQDSYSRYVPGAAKVADAIHGIPDNVTTGAPFRRLFFTQNFVGLFFSFLGVGPVQSGIALTILKLLTVLAIFVWVKYLFGARIAATAGLIYVFTPTIIYYTTVFYKEAAVQLMTAAILLSASKLYGNYLKSGYWALGITAMWLLLTERFYVFFLFLLVFVLFLFALACLKGKRYLLVTLPLIGAGFFLLLHKYAAWMSGRAIEYHTLFPEIMAAIREFRLLYSQHPGVDAINYTLPYPLAFLKLLFTPFFTLNKFSMFSDYSYILIWGSLANQAVVALSLYGMYRVLKTEWAKHCFLIAPYFIFLCIFAYVAPYSGRLRDSFYPLIVMYAAWAVSEIYRAVMARCRRAEGARSGRG